MRQIKAVLRSIDAQTATAVPIHYNGSSGSITINEKDEIRIESIALNWAGAAGDVHVYFSTDGTSPASWQTIARGGVTGLTNPQVFTIVHHGLNFTAPPGYKIYLEAEAAGTVNVVINGAVIQR